MKDRNLTHETDQINISIETVDLSVKFNRSNRGYIVPNYFGLEKEAGNACGYKIDVDFFLYRFR